MRDTRRHADRLVGDCCTPFQNFSQRERDVEECHRRVGHGSARSIRVAVVVVVSSAGHSGAASATWEHVHRHFAVAALLSPNAAMYLNRANPIELQPAYRFRLDGGGRGAWRHHVSMRPSSRSQWGASRARRDAQKKSEEVIIDQEVKLSASALRVADTH